MSGTDPDKRRFAKGDPTNAFRPDQAGPDRIGEEPPPTENLPKIPGITLYHEIARGGMGVVYSGRQDFLDRRVAVKFLSVELGGASFAQRFQREAKILAGIKHPNIVACHMADTTDDGQSYLVMEFIDGPSLKGWIADNGPTSASAALRLTRATAQALAHANLSEVIHRDVKPENILLETMTSTAIDIAFPFTPKLVDLGLARMTHEQVGQGLTSPGSVMGTPATMSPEQFDDPDSVDFRSDIYGLGCCLYEMLVGKPAFRGKRLTDIVVKKREPVGPNPCAENPSVPAAVGALTQRMLASNREDRPSSYKELDELLGELMKVVAAATPAKEFRADQTGVTIVGGGRPGQGAPPPAEPTAPGLLRTAELDFLSADGGVGQPQRTAFREGSAIAEPGTATVLATKSRLPLVGVVAAVVIAAGLGVYFGTRGDGARDGRTANGGGEPPVAADGTLVIAKIDGPKTVNLGISFFLTAEVRDPGNEPLEYDWQWPNGTLLASGQGEKRAQFRLDDGLPGLEFVFQVTVSRRGGKGKPVQGTHEIVVGDCPVQQPLIGFESKPEWQADRLDLAWREKTDPADRHVSCRAKKALRTMTTRIGGEAYWEWFGTLESNEDQGTPFATLGLRFEFGEAGYAVQCTREEEGALWSVEIMERIPSGDGYRPLATRSFARFRQPTGTIDEYRAWFRVRRELQQLTLQIGESRQAPPPSETEPFPDPVVVAKDSVSFTLPEGTSTGQLTLYVDQGIGRFRLKRR